jgi:hypothetical protein
MAKLITQKPTSNIWCIPHGQRLAAYKAAAEASGMTAHAVYQLSRVNKEGDPTMSARVHKHVITLTEAVNDIIARDRLRAIMANGNSAQVVQLNDHREHELVHRLRQASPAQLDEILRLVG